MSQQMTAEELFDQLATLIGEAGQGTKILDQVGLIIEATRRETYESVIIDIRQFGLETGTDVVEAIETNYL